MKKGKLILLVSLMSCTMAIIGYKNYGLSQIEFLIGNIEAMAEPETGPINLDFCFENGSSGSLSRKPECAKGTTVTTGAPSIPMGDISPCGSEVGGGLLTKIGYCYKSK